jgi:hypothetical protein
MNNSRHAIGRPRLAFSQEPAGAVDAVTPERDPVDALASDRARVTQLLALPESRRTPETSRSTPRSGGSRPSAPRPTS